MTAHETTHAPAEASPAGFGHGHGHEDHGAGDHGYGPHHVTPASTFLNVLIALLILTVITVGASRINFGSANLLIAMVIACIKASLVIAIFMHVKWDTAINKIVFLSSFLFLSLLFLFTLSDQATRTFDGANERTRAPVDHEWKHPSTLQTHQ
jgi:cytochrome c oxidase subunit 4